MTEYNGWTNKATWQVNMELLGDYDTELFYGRIDNIKKYNNIPSVLLISSTERETVLDGLTYYLTEYLECLAVPMIDPFRDCNYREIAEHIYSDYYNDLERK
jgi:hypothetical protein